MHTEAPRTLTLPAPYPPVKATPTVEPETGRVFYHVVGRRISGHFTVRPQTDTDSALPTKLTIHSGRLDRLAVYSGRKVELPLVNGVAVSAIISRSLDQLDRLDHRRLNASRTVPEGRRPARTEALPDPTARYLAALLVALLVDFAARPDAPALLRRAAQLDARKRLDTITDDRAVLEQQITALRRQAAAAGSVANDLAALLTTPPTVARGLVVTAGTPRRSRSIGRRSGRRAGSRARQAHR
ncbi:hypothetical protein AB0M43_36265 [Longispora sp. NPDC051575]|uniref:hypothetical protein n=1 Tax=Longispora sp. NPDC051575 TaxID=3154943 RepID=UPI003422C104